MKITSQKRSGFVLLEIILALGLFSIVATAMVIALDRLSVATISARKEAACLQRLESVLTEIQHSPAFRPGRIDFPAETEGGVSVAVEIASASLNNKRGQPLPGLFTVKAIAQLGPEFSRDAETMVFKEK